MRPLALVRSYLSLFTALSLLLSSATPGVNASSYGSTAPRTLAKTVSIDATANPPLPSTPSSMTLSPEMEKLRARQAMEAALAKHVAKDGARYQVDNLLVTLQGDWAYTIATKQGNNPVAAESLTILAHRLSSGEWLAVLPQDREAYLQWLDGMPETLFARKAKEQIRTQVTQIIRPRMVEQVAEQPTATPSANISTRSELSTSISLSQTIVHTTTLYLPVVVEGKWALYSNERFGYSIEYPPGYKAVDHQDMQSNAASGGVPSDVWFSDQIHLISRIPALPDDLVTRLWSSAQKVVLASNLPAYRREYLSHPIEENGVETRGKSVLSIEYFVRYKDADYFLSYNAPTDDSIYLTNRKIFERMVASFQILPERIYSESTVEAAAATATAFDFFVDPPNGGTRAPSYASYNVKNPYLSGVAPCYNKAYTQIQHTAEDWFRSSGTNVYAVANGRVIWAQNANYPGAVVIIEHTLGNGWSNPWGGNLIYSVYSHLQTTGLIAQWSDVTKGQVIGSVLDQSSNSHVHFEIRRYGDMSSILVCPANGASSWPGPGYTDTNVNPDNYGYTNPSAWIDGHRSSGGGGGDTTKPDGDITSPSEGATINSGTVRLSGVGSDSQSGFDHAHFTANYGGSWRQVSSDFTSSPFGLDWDMCNANVPDGSVEIGLDIWDKAGNQANSPHGTRHFIKNYNCNQPPPTCNYNADQIALFVDPNYSGQCVVKGIGDYSNPSAIGLPNDAVSSIRVGSNVKATLCKDDNYVSCEDFTGDDSNLADNGIGDNQVSSVKVQQRPSPPNPNFDAWPQSGLAPLVVSMHIVDTSNISSCQWDYGDGQTGTSCSSYHNHTYTNAGTYTVKLTVTGPGGSASKTIPNYITVTSPVQIPAAPTLQSPSNGATINEGAAINLAWSATGDQYYGEFWGGPGGTSLFGWQSETTRNIGSQWAGYTYSWHVKAKNSAGESGWSSTWTFTVKPATPTNLNAQAASKTQVNLSWIDNSGSEEGYQIYRGGTLLAQVGMNATTYQDTSATCNTSYTYQVKAYRGSIQSDGSNTASVTTPVCEQPKPDLVPYQGANWAFPVVPASIPGIFTTNTLYANHPTYFDWGVKNQGNAATGALFYVDLYIDNTRFIHYPFNADPGTATQFPDWNYSVDLTGPHTVKVVVDPDNAIVESDETNNVWQRQFTWMPVNGWWGEYFNSLDLSGNQVLVRDDANINFDWGSNSPGTGVNNDFSARWTRNLTFDAGLYRFSATHDDGMRVWVDGQLKLDQWNTCCRTDTVDVPLAAGQHALRTEFQDIDGSAVAQLSWTSINCGNDNLEPNNTAGQAKTISYNQTLQATICPAGDEDYYAFAGRAGDKVVADIDAQINGSMLDAYLFLLDSDGATILAFNDDEHTGLQDSHLGYTLPHDGNYYLKVREFNHPNEGGENYFYSIRLSTDNVNPYLAAITAPHNNDWLNPNQTGITVSADDHESGISRVEFLWHDGNGQHPDWVWLGADEDGSDGWSWNFDTSTLPEQQGVTLLIWAFDWANNWTGASVASLGIDRTPPTSAVLALPATSAASFTVSWSGSDATSGIANYDIQDRDGATGNWTDWLVDTTNTSSVFSGQTGHVYYFRSRANDRASNVEDWPASSSGDAYTEVRITLTAPSNLAATATGQTQINLSWTDNSNNETGFKLERSPDGTTNWTQIATVGANVTSYANIGLACGTTYYYRVRATNGSGDSDYSNVVNVQAVACGPVNLIFADGFESGDLSKWSSSSGAGCLSVTPTAALVGTKGLQVNISSNTACYVTDETPITEPRYRARFYFDPNTIKMKSGNAHYIFYGYSGATTVVLRVEFGFASGKYQLRAGLINDTTTWKTSSWATITDAPHWVELDWQASANATAKNGSLTFWIDGVQKASLTKIDNDTRRIDRVQLGAVSGIDTGTRGAYYFDAFEAHRQNPIGAAASGVTQLAPVQEALTDTVDAATTAPAILSAAPVQVGVENHLAAQVDSLKVQVNFLAATGTLATTARIVASDNATSPDGYKLLGNRFVLRLDNTDGAQATTTGQPFTLRIDYSALNESIATPGNLSLQMWNGEAERWEELPATVNLVDQTVTAVITQPATLALWESEATQDGQIYLPVIQQ